MARSAPRTMGESLRLAADRLYALAERADTPTRALSARQQLHDDIEVVASDVRASVRGRSFLR